MELCEEVEGVAATQRGGLARLPRQKADLNGANYPHKSKECYHCNTQGHIAADCPLLGETERGIINAQFGYMLLQKTNTVRTS